MTVRELVAEMQREIRDEDLSPRRACELLVRLSALTGNCREAIRVADHEVTRHLIAYLDSGEPATKAKIRVAGTPEYQHLQEAKDTLSLCEEMIKSLKYLIRVAGQEMELTR